MAKGTSIAPSSFTDSLHNLSIEEVVARFGDEERKRKDNHDDIGQRAVPIRFRTRPIGLEMSIDELHENLGVGERVLTRCMSRHAESWLQSLPQIASVVELYREVRRKADGQEDIEEWLKRGSNFDLYGGGRRVTAGAGMSSYSSTGWIRDYISELSSPLGIDSYKLFLIGLCWSASTNTSGCRQESISKYLTPETKRFVLHIQKRELLLDCYNRILDLG